MEIRRTARVFGCLSAVALAGAIASGCRNRQNLAERVVDDPASVLAAQRCGGSGQIVRPLIIEWPATDRASLEGRLRQGKVIVVRYEGCAVEVMRECAAPETGYDYIGITRKNDRITIRTTDELYVNMPLTAVNLEAKLAKAGELNVAMALVGNYEAQRSRFDVSELSGRCDGATHVIAAAQVGAFEFYSGAGAEIGAGVEVENVAGAGGRSTASREILNEDGDAQSCEASSPSDAGPPPECGALLRLELTALDRQTAPPTQPANTTQPTSSTEPVVESESDTIARQLCEIQLQCEAEALGVLPPEGQAYARQIDVCVGMTRPMINDYTRPQARKCVADFPQTGCSEFEACVAPPEPPDPMTGRH
jgi:hypothetical protein